MDLKKEVGSSSEVPVIFTVFDMENKQLIINPLNAELNPICHLLALLGAHHILHVSRIRVKAGNLIGNIE
jgi:hypothetical protein